MLLVTSVAVEEMRKERITEFGTVKAVVGSALGCRGSRTELGVLSWYFWEFVIFFWHVSVVFRWWTSFTYYIDVLVQGGSGAGVKVVSEWELVLSG